MEHSVLLPHPSKEGPKVRAVCYGGDWEINYGWGEHDDAAYRAEQHIEEAAKAHAFRADPTLAGDIWVMEGTSL
jgi:hypothetical protein